MEDFKKLPKMQHFKTGGSVKPKAMCYGGKAMKKGGEVDAADIKQDKAIVKKAFALHDKQEHHGEKTDLSTLKRGGRAKKAVGTVKKYKAGGEVTNVYEAKKSSGDKDNISKVKDIKPTKLCGGKSVKKMASGDLTGALMGVAGAGTAGLAAKLAEREMYKKKMREKYLGPSQQAELASQQAQATAAQPPSPAAMTAAPPQNPMGDVTGMPAQKRGGKVKKGCK